MKITKGEVKITKEMVDYVRGLGNGTIKPEFLDDGLCGNFYMKFKAHLHRVFDYYGCCDAWPKFSGNYNYPVPYSIEPCTAYLTSCLWSDDYGKLRREFCLHVADFMEGLLNAT